MKAQLLTAFGGTESFQWTDVPTPTPGAGQVLVRVRAIGINALECKIRQGLLEAEQPTPLPAILGHEFAGSVETLGEGVKGFKLGNPVVGFSASGAYAQYAVANAEALSLVPEKISLEQAATLPVAIEAAIRGISGLGIQSNWTVVINGASDAVGSAAVQLLEREGVRVIGTASERNRVYLKQLGAIPVTYGEGVADRIRELAPQGVDAVFDVSGHGFAATAVELTGNPARVLTIADFEAAALGVKVSAGSSALTAQAFAHVLPLAAAGQFRTEISNMLPLKRIATAHALSEAGHACGKLIVTA